MSVNPDAPEQCNNVDDNCNGVPDDNPEDPPVWVRDEDGDGHGAEASGTLAACDQPAGTSAATDPQDCDDADEQVFPGAAEDCGPVDRDCDGDPSAGAVDPETFYADVDGDGFGDVESPGYACEPGAGLVDDDNDCDDLDPDVHPDAEELCNEVDDDCDDNVDFGAVDRGTYFLDTNSDGYGVDTSTVLACSLPSGYAATAGDCNDSALATNPGAAETCGGADENCDGSVDEPTAADATVWYADADGDTFGEPATSQAACTQPSGYVLDNTDCDDSSSAVSPVDPEVCGGSDENCDGATDESTAADAVDHYDDLDGDTYGDVATLTHGCLPAGRVTDGSDCDDGNADANPGELEVCGDGVDEDCDGLAAACFLGTYTTADADAVITNSTASEAFGWTAAAGDLTGDGQDDLVVLANSSDELHLFAGPVTSTSTAAAAATYTDAGAVDTYWTRGLWADQDFNGDGQDDLAMYPCEGTYSSYYDNNICVAFGPVDPGDLFYPRFSPQSGHSQPDADVGDIDGNGIPEVLTILDTSMLYAYEPADGAFTYSNVWLGTGPYIATIAGSFGGVASGADFNGDGADEVALDVAGAFYVHDTLFLGGHYIYDAAAVHGVPGANLATEMVGDLDGDGLDDLLHAALSSSPEAVYVLTDPLTSGDVTAVAAASITSSSSSGFPQSMETADLNGDGVHDLLLGTFDDANGAAYVFYGPLSGSYVAETDADAALLNPTASPSSYVYTMLLPVGDVLGFGTETLLLGAPDESAGAGGAWLFGM